LPLDIAEWPASRSGPFTPNLELKSNKNDSISGRDLKEQIWDEGRTKMSLVCTLRLGRVDLKAECVTLVIRAIVI
jgi:hypothetical protein